MQDYQSVKRQDTQLSSEGSETEADKDQQHTNLIKEVNSIFDSKADYSKIKTDIQA